MKSISIPAQVTTVEDRIIGNLTLTQLVLLVAPIFVDFALYAVLPRPMHINTYKLVLVFIITSITFVSAIKFKEKILLLWLITIAKFRFRAKIYVFSKKSIYFRDVLMEKGIEASNKIHVQEIPRKKSAASVADDTDLDKLDLNFIKEDKGKLYVYVNEP